MRKIEMSAAQPPIITPTCPSQPGLKAQPMIPVARSAAIASGTLSSIETARARRSMHPPNAAKRRSTGMSQGLFCAEGTKAQAAAGIGDDGETFLAEIITKTRGQEDPLIARTLAFESGPTADWLVETHGLPKMLDLGFCPAYDNSRARVHGWHGHGGVDIIPQVHQKLSEAGVAFLLQARVFGGVAGQILSLLPQVR